MVLAGGVLFVTGVFLLQRTRTFGHLVSAMRRIGLSGHAVERVEAAIGRDDGRIRELHRRHPKRFLPALP